MTKRTKDKFVKSILLALCLGILGWAGNSLLIAHNMPDKIESLQEEADENRESIQGLIDLHMKK